MPTFPISTSTYDLIKGNPVLIAVWQDYKTVMDVFYPIINSTIGGTDNRFIKVHELITEIYDEHEFITSELLSANISYGLVSVRKILKELAEQGILIESPELKIEKGIKGNTKIYRYDQEKGKQYTAFSENAVLNWANVLKKQREWLKSERDFT